MQPQQKNGRYLNNLMDPDLQICELSDAQPTSCTLFEGLLSPYVTEAAFASLDRLSINPVSKIGEAMKGKFNFLLLKFSQNTKQKTLL